MNKYTYQCSTCRHIEKYSYKPGEAPRKISCTECGEESKRVLKPVIVKNNNKKEDTSKNKKVKKNLKKRQEKVDGLDPREKDKFKKWSYEQTGGRW